MRNRPLSDDLSSIRSDPELLRALNARGSANQAARAFCFALPEPAGDAKAPEWIPYLPAPDAKGMVTGEDGRSWKLTDAKALAAKLPRKLPVDVNHSTDLLGKKGHEAPAYGFITAFRVNDDGTTSAKVSWNKRGLNALEGKEYGFISPFFDHDAKTNVIVAYAGASLCNEPNFNSLALNQRGAVNEDAPMLEALLAALGLSATVSQEDAVRAINTLKDERQRALNAAATPDLTRFVPRADHDAMVQRATNAEGSLKKVKDDQAAAEIDREIDGALKAGKITPATKDYHRANCAREGGLEAFRAFVKGAPVVAADQVVQGDPEKGAEGLTESQRAICRRIGMDPKKYAESAVAYRSAEAERRGEEKQAA